MRKVLVATALVLAAHVARADVPAMTLADALVFARSHHPQIRRALAERAARTADARVPRAQWLPRLGATAQVFLATDNNSSAVSLGLAEVDVPRIGGTPGRTTGSTRWTPAGSTLVAASVDQEVYDFGRIAARTAMLDATAAMARADAETAALDVQLAVEEAFHGVLAARAILEATRDAERRAVTHRDYAKAGAQSGLRPPIDLTRAQADVAVLDVKVVRAVAGLELARASLAAAIGSDALLVDAAPVAPDESPSPALDSVLRTAASKNPVVAAAVARLDAQRQSTHAITREVLPNLFATAGISGRAGGEAPSSGDVPYGGGWLPDVPNWHLGAVLSWTPFDATILARRRASIERERVQEAELDVVKLSTSLGAESAYLRLEAALKVVPGLVQAVQAARANQAQADARFRAGLGTVVELADAEALLTSSELELAIGEYDVARARAALGRVMGDLLSVEQARTR